MAKTIEDKLDNFKKILSKEISVQKKEELENLKNSISNDVNNYQKEVQIKLETTKKEYQNRLQQEKQHILSEYTRKGEDELIEGLGRVPHHNPWSPPGSDDHRLIGRCLQQVGLAGRERQSCARLSGGERHRVVLARALAQRAPLMFLDEPTNHLDVAWRQRLMRILDELPVTLVAAMHDLDLVLRHFDHVAVVAESGVIAHGRPVRTLTPDLLRRVFGIDGEIITHPRTGRPHLLVGDAVPAADLPESGTVPGPHDERRHP